MLCFIEDLKLARKFITEEEFYTVPRVKTNWETAHLWVSIAIQRMDWKLQDMDLHYKD